MQANNWNRPMATSSTTWRYVIRNIAQLCASSQYVYYEWVYSKKKVYCTNVTYSCIFATIVIKRCSNYFFVLLLLPTSIFHDAHIRCIQPPSSQCYIIVCAGRMNTIYMCCYYCCWPQQVLFTYTYGVAVRQRGEQGDGEGRGGAQTEC